MQLKGNGLADRHPQVRGGIARYREMVSTWQEPRVGYMTFLVLRQRLFSSHRRYCGSIQHSDLFTVIIIDGGAVRQGPFLRLDGLETATFKRPSSTVLTRPPRPPPQGRKRWLCVLLPSLKLTLALCRTMAGCEALR